MAVSFTLTRTTTRFHDSNGNGVKDAGELDFDFGEVGVYDPGDILYTRIKITNTGDQTATGVTVSDNFAGSTFVDASNAVSGTPFLNISPIAFNDTFQAIGNTVLRVGTAGTINGGESTTFAGNLISNDVGSLAGDSISGFQIDVVGDGTFAGSGVTAKGGHYNILADGSFNYVNSGSDASLTDGDSFTYTIRDKGFDGVYNTADDLTSTATVTITFAEQSPGVAHRVWYVDSNAAPGGDGTSANPFQTMAVINGVTGDGTTNDDLDQAGEYIYVENGAGAAVTGPITLESGQQLIGKGAALIVAGATLATAGTNSTLSAPAGTIVTLGSGNTIAGINIGNGTGTATGIAGTNFGTLTVNSATIDTVGSALNLTTGAFAGSGFTTVNSDGGTNNVSFVNVTGTVALGGGALTGASGASLNMVSSGAANGLNVTYSGSITQGNNAALLNVDGGTNGHTGTLTLSGTINATNGTGLQFTNADGTYNLSGNTTLNGGDAGIDILTGSAGNFTFGNAGVTTTNVTNNSGGDAFVVNASNATVVFNGTITDNNGNAVAIDNHDGGTITFQNGSINSNGSGIDVTNSNGGAINFNSQITLSTGANTAITLTANNSSTTSFSPTGTGLDVTTSSGSGIVANNAGAITIADSGSGNTITVTAGGAGAVAFSASGGTTIAAGGVIFDSISQTGGLSGIVLNNTGASGSFQVLGDSGSVNNSSGGTIQNTTGDGVKLTSATNLSFDQININNTGISGIDGTDVTNFALTNSTINNSGLGGATANASSVAFNDVSSGVNNLDGTVTITGNTLTNAWNSGVQIYNESGTISNLNISTNTMTASGNVATSKGSGIQVDINGSAGTAAAVSAGTINSNVINDFVSGAGIQFQGGNGALGPAVTMGTYQTTPNTGAIIQIANNTIGSTSSGTPMGTNGIAFGTTGTGQGNFAVTGNNVSHFLGIGIAGFGGNKANVSMFVDTNVVDGTDNIANSSGIAIGSQLGGADATHTGTVRATISNNNVSGMEGVGILAGITNSYNTGYFKIVNNTVGNPQAAGNRSGIRVESGSAVGDATLFLEISGNTSGAIGLNPGISLRKQGSVSTVNEFHIEGLSPSPANHAQTEAYVAGLNPGSAMGTGNSGGASRVLSVSGDQYLSGNVDFLMAVAPPTTVVVVNDDPSVAPPIDVDEPVVVMPEVGPSVPAPAPTPAPSGPVVVDDGVLSQAELDLVVEAAIQRWISAGATDEQVAAMRAVHVSVADLAGLKLGESRAGEITLDSDAAGWRWFVDSTPGDDSEYAGSGTRLAAANPYGMAGTRIDLLTVVTHELGHQIGLADLSGPGLGDELMYGTIGAGERRLPGSDDLSYATGTAMSGAFAFAPITLGTIPAGQIVIVEFRHVIDTPGEDRLVGAWTGQTTLDSDQTSPQVSNAETGNIDGLTLGSLVYRDVNRDGDYDSGTDSPIAGVSLTLYGDTNNNGVYDDGVDLYVGYNELGGGAGYQQGIDTPAAPGTGTALTVTTAADGSYSFGSLAPGDYIVRVNAGNFTSGQPLYRHLLAPGIVVNDPDDNVDNDNNAVAAANGPFASRAITLSYNNEGPTFTGGAGTSGNDTNNTLDLGFVANVAPVANADSLAATEDTQAQYSTQLTGNDTDADLDTLTITGVSNFVNGTGSVAGGIVTFNPTANFNGTASFDYTIDDGNGHTATATATVTVGAVNDPVTTAAPATATMNEDAVDFAVTGLSIADVDAALAPAGVYEVVLSATHGTLKLTTITGLTFTVGDGDGDPTMTFHGTLAAINIALATAKYSPTANYNGSAQIQLQATDAFGATVATGTGSATNDSDTVAVTVNSVNDAPVGANQNSAATAGVEYVFSATDFSENFTDPVEGNGFAGIRITSTPATGTLKLNGVGISVPTDVTLLQLTNGNLTYDPGPAGTSPTFQFRVRDDGGTANGGQDLAIGENVYTVNIAAANAAPVLDLDASGAGTGFASAYTEGGAAAAISDTDVLITDADSGDMIEGATITITNAVSGDVLTVVGALPGSITLSGASTATNLILTGTGTQAQYEAAIEQITFSNTGDDPTALGTNNSRTINVTVTDGDATSNVAVATISVADDNADAPSGTSATITAIEDTFRLIGAADLGFSDVDGTFAGVEISAVTGGSLYYDADGTAGAGAPVLVATLPQTYTAQDLIDGKVSFLAAPNANGAGLGTITFAVRDDDGNVDGSPNVLTIDVTAVNDSPELTTGGPIAATEQTAVAILPAGAVSDIDLDALNGGNGNYAGASFSVNRNPATNTTEDVFTLVAGPNFTIDGSDLKSGGQIFGTISVDGSAGLIVINFTSSGTPATSALVDEVIQAVRYTNTSNTPPASVDLSIGFDDGSPGGGQGAGATDLDINLVTVNFTAANDAPTTTASDVSATEQTPMSLKNAISVADVDAASGLVSVDVTVGYGVLNASVGTSGVIVSGIGSSGVRITGTIAQVNDFLSTNATSTFTYTADTDTPPATTTLTVLINDNGNTGGGDLTGTDSATITITGVNDAPVAQPDAVSTFENAIGTGNLFNNNGSGPDSDPEGDLITISEVNGSPADVGMEITLASGAKLTVNSDGTYSYNPFGKFNRLTDNTSGAVNTSQVGDTFSYTVTGGNTVTVTVTVNGVAGPGDWLMGDGTDNIITGTPQADTFVLGQGGDDTVTGLGSDDIFYFGGALTAADNVTGGSGADTIVLQGNYSGLTLDSSVAGVERISMLAGTNTAFGDPGTNLYDYVLTIDDANFLAGEQVRINGGALLAGEDFTFDGSAETDAKFVIYGGKGTDNLTGGDGNDIFFFAEAGRFAAGDKVNGGDGYDGLFLRGNYTINLTLAGFAGALSGIENLTVSGASDERYGRGGGTEFDYSITWDGDLLGAGQTMTINGATLQSQESLSFNGSDETNGNFRIFGGAGIDVLIGGGGADLIFGGLRGDTLTGGGGNDTFRYDNVAESNSTERDGIQDFNSGDVIDLSRIDANTLLDGDQAFSFIGSAAFSNTAGQLRFENISLGGPIWLVQGDIDGNGVSDFEVVLVINPADPITASDFIL